jgi:hypothetical protein
MSTLFLALLPTLYLAQVAAPPDTKPVASPSLAAGTADDTRFDDLRTEATAAYDRNDLEGALGALQQAHALRPARIDLLFNIAQVQFAQRSCAAALGSYRLFLAQSGPVVESHRSVATKRAAEMQACVDRSAAVPPAPIVTQNPARSAAAGADVVNRSAALVASTKRVPPAAAPGWVLIDPVPAGRRGHPGLRAGAWGLLAVAVLAAGACAYLTWRASADADYSGVTFGTPRFGDQWQDGPRDQRWARGAGVAAIIAGAGGAALMMMSRPEPAPAAGGRPGWGAGPGWRWRF